MASAVDTATTLHLNTYTYWLKRRIEIQWEIIYTLSSSFILFLSLLYATPILTLIFISSVKR
jgi:hypothetical protein